MKTTQERDTAKVIRELAKAKLSRDMANAMTGKGAKPGARTLTALDKRFDARIKFRQDVAWFEKEYRKELRRPSLKLLAGELDARLAKKHPRMRPKTRLRKVGERIRRELKKEKAA